MEGGDQGSHESKLFTTGTPTSQPEELLRSQNELQSSVNASAVSIKPIENLEKEKDGKVGEVTDTMRNKTAASAAKAAALGTKYPAFNDEILPPSLLPVEHPKPEDILFGRGGLTNNHIGNRNFRDIISAHKDDYLKASKLIKPRIARSIVMSIRTSADTPGRFLKKKDGIWYDVGDRQAIEKVAQGLREKCPMLKKEIKANKAATMQEAPRMYVPVAPYPMHPAPPVQSNLYSNYMVPYPPYNSPPVIVTHFHPPHQNMTPYGFSPYKVAETLEERKEAEHYSPSKDLPTISKATETKPLEGIDKEDKGNGSAKDEVNNASTDEQTKENVSEKEEDNETKVETAQTEARDTKRNWKVEGGVFGLVDSLGFIIVTEHDILCGRGGATNHHKVSLLFFSNISFFIQNHNALMPLLL